MLRNKRVVSPVSEFTDGKFRSVLDDPHFADRRGPQQDVRRLLLCSGKVYYDLAAARDKAERSDVAIVRVEQLYPLPKTKLQAMLERYPNATDIRWVQEEPANQGAWPYFGLALPEYFPNGFAGIKRVSRRRMAAPAAGSGKVHEVEQAQLVESALGD
jgi:2-oxoglutarate decarboxylase